MPATAYGFTGLYTNAPLVTPHRWFTPIQIICCMISSILLHAWGWRTAIEAGQLGIGFHDIYGWTICGFLWGSLVGAAFFMPFAPRKDTAVQVPEVVAAMPKQKEDQVPAVASEVKQDTAQAEACQATDDEPKQPASSPPQPAFVKANRPDLKGYVAVPVQLGDAKPAEEKGVAAVAAPTGKQHSAEVHCAGSGPLPSKTAGPPQPRSSRETSRKPLSELSPQRLGDVPWQSAAGIQGPYPSALPPRPPGQMGADTSSPPPGARWPELQRPPAFLRESFNLGGSSAGDINGFAGMPPAWQGNGWRARDQGEEDLMLQRAYEVYRQQQLELLRS